MSVQSAPKEFGDEVREVKFCALLNQWFMHKLNSLGFTSLATLWKSCNYFPIEGRLSHCLQTPPLCHTTSRSSSIKFYVDISKNVQWYQRISCLYRNWPRPQTKVLPYTINGSSSMSSLHIMPILCVRWTWKVIFFLKQLLLLEQLLPEWSDILTLTICQC